ncbi:nuclease-related domain-containing protein [Streptomyces noursei]
MAHPHRIKDAGASALQQAEKLRTAEISRQHRRGIPLLVLATAAGYAISLPAQHAGAPLAVVVALIAAPMIWVSRRAYRPGETVRRWRQGAEGERRTATLLHPLTRRGWIVLHDRALAGTRANLDHLALDPAGRSALYLDTKYFRHGVVGLRNGSLACGKFTHREAIATVRWEAQRAAVALGVPVTPLIVIHGARVPGGRIETGDITIISARHLRAELRTRSGQPNFRVQHALAQRAEAALPRYTAAR